MRLKGNNFFLQGVVQQRHLHLQRVSVYIFHCLSSSCHDVVFTACPECSCPICTCPSCPMTLPPCTCATEIPTLPPQPLEGRNCNFSDQCLCLHELGFQFHAGVHFVLRGQPLANNSVIALADVGEIGDALKCKTNLTNCCGTVSNRFGQFYYPNGLQVPINNRRQGFYRNRGDQEIRLHRRSGVSSPTGRFRCEIPDSNMAIQKLFILLV